MTEKNAGKILRYNSRRFQLEEKRLDIEDRSSTFKGEYVNLYFGSLAGWLGRQ